MHLFAYKFCGRGFGCEPIRSEAVVDGKIRSRFMNGACTDPRHLGLPHVNADFANDSAKPERRNARLNYNSAHRGKAKLRPSGSAEHLSAVSRGDRKTVAN
jgi:hypothetical protein